jgi:hypothetical protein
MVSIIKEFTRGVTIMATPHTIRVNKYGIRVHTFEQDIYDRLREKGVKPPYCANQIEYALTCKSVTEAADVVAFDTAFWNGELTRGW